MRLTLNESQHDYVKTIVHHNEGVRCEIGPSCDLTVQSRIKRDSAKQVTRTSDIS